MSAFRLLVFGLVVAAAGCEDGPDQIFKPLAPDVDRAVINGLDPGGHVNEGKQPFEFEQSGVQENTAVICEADELAKRWAKMVKEPIIPTRGAGGLDLRGQPEWSGLTIDDAQQQLCQAYVYTSQIYFWGDNAELLAIFDTKTRLITQLITLPGYEGTIKAGKFEIAMNKAIQLDGSRFSNPTLPANMMKLNSALLKAFRPEMPNPDQRDCVKANTCYTYDWQTRKVLMFNDVSLAFIIEPEGQRVLQLEVWVKRAFSFTTADVEFVTQPPPTAGLAPQPRIAFDAKCSPTLGSKWEHVKSNCLGSDKPEKAQANADSSGEQVYVDMGGLALYLGRSSLAADAILPDDVKPESSDEIVAMSFGIDYDGWLTIPRGEVTKRFLARTVADITGLVPAMNGPGDAGGGQGAQQTWGELLQAAFDRIQPKGDPNLLKLGSQRIEECDTLTSCTEHTLILRAHQLLLEGIKKSGAAAPDEVQHPNWLVERYLAEILAVFNDDQTPTEDELYYYPTSDSADVLVAVLARQLNGERYAVRTAYHNKSDQLVFLFFKKGPMRAEKVLYKDAELKQYDNTTGDGKFRLWNFARSPRVGLGTKIVPTKELTEIRKATISLSLGGLPEDVLVSYSKQDSLSGFSIPVEGQRDKFEPAAYFGFSGNVIAGAVWAKDGIVRAVSSSAFYDTLDFCGVEVALWDRVEPLLASLPDSCEKIVSFSENGKLITALSTYVAEDPFKIGLRLWITAGRVDAAYYWAEE